MACATTYNDAEFIRTQAASISDCVVTMVKIASGCTATTFHSIGVYLQVRSFLKATSPLCYKDGSAECRSCLTAVHSSCKKILDGVTEMCNTLSEVPFVLRFSRYLFLKMADQLDDRVEALDFVVDQDLHNALSNCVKAIDKGMIRPLTTNWREELAKM